MKRYWKRNNQLTVDNSPLTIFGVRIDGLYALSIALCQLSILMLLTTSCSQNKKHADKEQYTCPMHPTVVQDKPGNCPVCGMDLVLKGGHQHEAKIGDEMGYLLKPVNATVISSIKTITPVRRPLNIKITSTGIITYDTRTLTTVSSRFSGRIEKLFFRYNLQPIRRGQKIFEIYSPELLTAQRDLLYLLNADNENSQLIDGAKEKLKLLGASEEQINQLISTGKESTLFSVYSPAEGYIINSNGNVSNQNELEVREGMYVTAGQIIVKVANPKNVWAEFDLHSGDQAHVKVNDPLQIKIEGTEELDAHINFLQPFFKEGQSFTKVRVYLSNGNGKYRAGQLVSASFDKPSRDSMWIPVSAQMNLGTRKIVFLKKEGIFKPQEIVTGSQSENWVEVLKGIDATDSVAYNAQFMVDSESFIKIKK